MSHKIRFLIVTALLGLLLAGCGALAVTEPPAVETPIAEGTGTEIVETATETLPPTETATPTEVPTDTPTVTLTPTVTNTPEPTLQPVTIIGRVWNDGCDPEGDIPEGAEVPAGCVVGPEGELIGDGEMAANEGGLYNIAVLLGQGACPSEIIDHAITNESGWYAFDLLAPGTYCVSVNPLHEHNMAIKPPLFPGVWTYPKVGIDYVTINLPYGGQALDINFGWDFSTTAGTCTNAAEIVEDVPLLNPQEIYQGDPLTKTWVLRNVGNCTWNENYVLLHTDGTLLTNAAATPLGEVVGPGETVEVSLNLTAPTELGSYTSSWRLRSDLNEIFGVGETADQPLTVNFDVRPDLVHTGQGEPSWLDTFADASNWTPFSDASGRLVIENGRMALTASKEYGYDIWTTSYPEAFDFFIEAVMTTGGSCAGSDRYGLLLRSSESDRGYLIGMTCDGRFSFRRWTGDSFIYKSGWTRSQYINTGPNATNNLGIRLVDENIDIYINGVLVAEDTDKNISGGKFGPFAAAATSSEFTVYFEQLAYWAIGAE
ncbi:MAG: hypothetical protein JXB38_18560 [Anaerolineales bacterium]|nr:hypothetical protein [Anaerolineales bacterium]